MIASQAVISGAFSLTQQSIQLGFLPRLRVDHTAGQEIGQIYIPFVNWRLAPATLGAVMFRQLGRACRRVRHRRVAIDGDHHPARGPGRDPMGFFAPPRDRGQRLLPRGRPHFLCRKHDQAVRGRLVSSLDRTCVAFLIFTWRAGVKLVERARANLRQPEEDLIETAVNKCRARLPGTAVFLASAPNGVPLALTQFVKHNHVLHERVLLVTVLIEESPQIADEDRAEVSEIIPGITRVILRYRFMQYPTIYGGLILACNQGKLPGIDLGEITYYVGRETIIPREDVPGMWVWRETVFAFLQRNAERSAAFFGVPTRQVVKFRTEIEI